MNAHDLQAVYPSGLPRPVPSLGIGVVGAGSIVEECHLPAYRKAGFKVTGIASRKAASAQRLGSRFAIPKVFDDWRSLIRDPEVEVVDVAVPPDAQPDIIRAICREPGTVGGVLAQKPLAKTLDDALEVVELCESSGVRLAVNQNMRYDPAMRGLKVLIDDGCLGDPVLAQITMHVRIDWMDYASEYRRKAMLIMSIHHIDVFRHLFGEPDRIVASTAPDPDQKTDRQFDQSAVYVLEYPHGFRAVAIDNCYSWTDQGIEWRVDGTSGLARGTVGWPDHPWGSPSRLDYVSREAPDLWFSPRWPDRWFPDAFGLTMNALLRHVSAAEPLDITGRDHLESLALVEAAYRSASERRMIESSEWRVLLEPDADVHDKDVHDKGVRDASDN